MKSTKAIRTEVQYLREMSQSTLEQSGADMLGGVAISSMCLGAAYALEWIMNGPPPSTMIQREAAKRRTRPEPQVNDK